VSAELAPFLIALIVSGAAAGLIAGLFGIGGGVIMVPALYYALSALGYEEHAMHAAVGTSLAVIIATATRSVIAHARRGAVDFLVLRQWAPWIVLGALSGSALAGFAPGRALTGLFGVVALLLSLQFFFGRPERVLAQDLPGLPLRGVLGGFIGVLSSLMGIGGGVFGVTLLTLCNRPIHQAVATAAGFGVAIGVPGAIGFIVTGLGEPGRAPGSLGYVSLPGFLILAGAAVTLTPLGARLAHALPAARLRKAFAIGLVLVAANMLYEAATGG